MNTVKYGSTVLQGTNLQGVLKPDADGYYEMIVGGMNMFNSAGEYYAYEGAKELFESSSQFMRRIKRGALRGEVGHPRREPRQSFDDYVNRIMEIRESNTCVHFKEINLDFNKVKDDQGKTIVAIVAKLKPSGPHGAMLEKSLNNKNENVCFSIRAFTQDTRIRGINNRVLKNVITWDMVNEPGLAVATKYHSPSLESLDESIITETQLRRICDNKGSSNIATESSRGIASELLNNMGWTMPKGVQAAYVKW